MADGFTPIPRIQVGGDSLVSAKLANQLIDAINALGAAKLAPIANFGSMKMAGGFVVYDYTAADVRLRALEGGSAAVEFPFQISALSNTVVNVRYGTIHDLAPTGVNTNITLSGTANYNIYLNTVINNNGIPTAASIGNTTGNVPTDTSLLAYKLIGQVGISSNNITQINQSLMFSQDFTACNRNTSDPTTTPGTYFFFVT